MNATLSIRGIYVWDNTVFDNLTVPTGMDKTTLVGNILMELAELEVIFPDPAVMKEAIGYWSTSRQNAWNKMYTAITASYNAIHNKDANVSETTNSIGTSSTESSGSVTGQVSAFNEADFQNANKNTSSSTGAGVNTGQVTFTRHEYGNIGVVSSQELVRSEMELREEYDIYRIITDEFKKKFCLMVY